MPRYKSRFKLEMNLDTIRTTEIDGEPFEAVDDTAAIEFTAAQTIWLATIHNADHCRVLEIRQGKRVVKTN